MAAQTHEPITKKKLDAGALFVLKSKGSWLHCGYHLTTAIVAPPVLSLPFAVASLGWIGGVVFLMIAAIVTFYSYNLLSLVLEHHAHKGNRLLRFRDMADHILGPGWGKYFVAPVQFVVCYGCVIASILLGAQCMKTFYLLSRPDGSMKLYEFVIILGAFTVVLAQIPSFHSLRHINLLSLILCVTYDICATAASVYIGNSNKGPPKDYSVQGNIENRIFNAFNAIAIIATAYGNGMIPEIQATIAPPVKGKMFKGLCVCYVVVIITFFGVSISGYWAFGNQAAGTVLTNFFSNGEPLVPKWFLYMINALTFIQVAAVGLVYLQPTNEILERTFADPQKGEFSKRNVVPRLISRSISIAIATLIAAMLPFFGDINGVIGAFGFIPLDFVLPVIFYNITFRPTKLSPIFWLNILIATIFSVVAVISAVAAVRQISLDAGTYRLFANV
ncbi:GABA transporter 1-like isoform X2 [Telopea speciosissima]|uniref:GABA transporter 1-like isoform X2 n=1 Tax=Telopea speciosissima TaxID=54955 RepID=UPI001CC5EF1F|nr:GABA transporter 1-like isoform X2 [Telopea speciosissima]